MSDLEIAPELRARVEALAVKASRSPAEVVADALEHGRSLEWQERFVERVRAGQDDAAAARFAGPADFQRLTSKYSSG